MRVLPKINEEVNEEWISDKSRHAFDGIKRQRISTPMRKDSQGNFSDITWDEALEDAAKVLSTTKPENIEVMIGDQADVESICALRDMMHRIGVENLEFRSVFISIFIFIIKGFFEN
jgi:NADH dehydrogenase/NADH:ubiquinone oxidoreductase subunit G